MPLLATALVLSDGGETVAILDVDAIGFDRPWTDRILQAIVDLTGLSRSSFSPNAAEVLVAESARLLHELAKRSAHGK